MPNRPLGAGGDGPITLSAGLVSPSRPLGVWNTPRRQMIGHMHLGVLLGLPAHTSASWTFLEPESVRPCQAVFPPVISISTGPARQGRAIHPSRFPPIPERVHAICSAAPMFCPAFAPGWGMTGWWSAFLEPRTDRRVITCPPTRPFGAPWVVRAIDIVEKRSIRMAEAGYLRHAIATTSIVGPLKTRVRAFVRGTGRSARRRRPVIQWPMACPLRWWKTARTRGTSRA